MNMYASEVIDADISIMGGSGGYINSLSTRGGSSCRGQERRDNGTGRAELLEESSLNTLLSCGQ